MVMFPIGREVNNFINCDFFTGFGLSRADLFIFDESRSCLFSDDDLLILGGEYSAA